jgi:hypothetical protein
MEGNKPYDVEMTQTKPRRVYIEYPEREGKE